MKITKYLLPLLILGAVSACGKKYSYETVEGDPIQARIYTLDNGLKVYMSVNRDEPRIQTNIAVRVGGKNDPAETTGLAHYFEHLMFKGTQQFGTSDYEAEKPLLDQIEELFELYRRTTGEAEREVIYARIDSISYEASKLSIPNEYDKLMAAIGADGTNAYTSNDVTAYVEDIPSNQVENWARIQSDRFRNPVLRGFHTELETIYEEKNMYLTNDSRKVNEAIYAALFPNHPYGTQTVLGSQEHLKNPSITNVRNYHKQWYVPNNMAVCLSGDFDPDRVIKIIDRYFGDMEPNPELPVLDFKPETPIEAPMEKEIFGPEAENVAVAWRIGGALDKDKFIATLAGDILYNGQAGLVDLNLNQQQRVLSAYGYAYPMADHGTMRLVGRPKAGQTLRDVEKLLLAEVAKLRSGDFDESLLKAAVNNYKANMMAYIDDNEGRVDVMVDSFINQTPWEEAVESFDILARVTKEDIVRYASEMLRDDNYVVIYKREGKDPNEMKMPKPTITPIETNRDAQSDFLKEIQATSVEPIEPVFADYDRDLSRFTTPSGIPVLYKKNETNGLFELTYMFEVGITNIPFIQMMANYLEYLGTDTRSAADIKREFYNLACGWDATVQDNRIRVSISGLAENMGAAMELFEDLATGAKGDENVLRAMKEDIKKSRANAKLNQRSNFYNLRSYATYGPEYIKGRVMNNRQVDAVSSKTLLDGWKTLMGFEHTVVYYGPHTGDELLAELASHHHTPAELEPVPARRSFPPLPTPDNSVLVAQYDAAQIYYSQVHNTGEAFDTANDAEVTLYNEYFGGGMNSIVFQEMREARGLAYSAQAWLGTPQYPAYDPDERYTFSAFIATQSDKMEIAIDAFEDIINNMPVSEAAFSIAKDALDSRLRTQRKTKTQVLWSYISARDKGVDYDRDRDIFERIQGMTLDDVTRFQQEWIKDKPYTFCILGNIPDLDMTKLRAIGPVKTVTKEEIFGY